MITKQRDSPGIRCSASKAIEIPSWFSQPVYGLVLLLLLAILYMAVQINEVPTEGTASSKTSVVQSATPATPSQGELIPVLTGGAGSSTSLGGGSSLGGSSHY